jgi:HAE1 family hydrophobic/amphiphilic exporter-1
LSAFVEVKDTVSVEFVTQFNLYESIELTITPAEKASTGDVMKIIKDVAGKTLPEDVGYAWSGTSFQEASASRSGAFVYLLALVFVFLALASLYNSWGLPVAILLSVPIAVLGAVVSVGAMHLVDAKYVNDIYMQISLVMLIGLAAKNAILVVEYADKMEAATIKTIENGIMTKDLVGLVSEDTKATAVNTLTFIKEIRSRLEQKLA